MDFIDDIGTSPYDEPRPHGNTTWTNERVELLKKLWADGLSTRFIAAEIGGITRNAVIGKVCRLGLPERGNSPSAIRARAVLRGPRKPVERVVRIKLPKLPRERKSPQPPSYRCEPAIPPDPSKMCGLLELTKDTCRYPLWADDASSGRFCGCQPVPGFPYCGSHARLCYGERRA
jgi:GcrA cell cycle regulator